MGASEDCRLLVSDVDGQGVEEVRVATLQAFLLKAGRQQGGQALHTLGDVLQARRAVVDRVEAGDIGQQRLGGADVGVGLLAADVLLAGLQGHTQGGVATGVFRHADDAARHGALVLVAAGEEGGVRAAVAHRYAEALGAAEHDVGTQLTRRGQQQQAEQVGRHARQGLLGVQLLDQRAQVADLAEAVRVLQQGAKHLVAGEVVDAVDHHVKAKGVGAGLHHGDGLRVAVLVNKEQVALALGDALGHGHGFGSGGGFVEQRGAGQVQTGEVDGQLLEVQQRFQTALGNFRLIRGVGGVPAWAHQHVADDHGRGHGAVVAHADQAGPQLVLLGIATQFGQGGFLVQRGRQVQRAVQANRRRHGLLDQLGTAAQAQGLKHGLLLRRIGAEVTAQKRSGLLQLGQGLGHVHALKMHKASKDEALWN